MAPHREFPVVRTADVPEAEDDPPTFSLGDRTFRLLPVLPAGAWLGLPFGPLSADEAARFIRRAMVEEDRAAFDEAMLDPRVITEPKTLGPIVDWILDGSEDGAGLSPFPQPPRGSSSNGAVTTTGSSAPGS